MSNKTHTELVANLQAWLEDDDSEFTASIDEIINLGEMRLWKDLDLSIFTAEESSNTSIGSPVLPKPTTDTELVAWQSLYFVDGNGKNVYLELRSTDFVRDHQVAGSTGSPRYYAEQSEDNVILSPIPDAIYAVDFRGTTRPTRLSVSNTTTWLSLHQDDLLFKACLAEAEKFLKSDDRAPMWEEDYVKALPLAKRETYTLLTERYNLTPLEIPGVPTTQR